MKKTILVVLMAIATACSAQLSLKFGFIASSIYSSEYKTYFKYNSKIRPLFGGIYYNTNVNNKFGLETGLQYQGYTESYVHHSDITKRHYLSLPIAINYKPTSLVSPGLGVQASYQLSSYSRIIRGTDYNFDLSLFGKVNINLIKNIGLEMGYNIGFLPFYKADVYGYVEDKIGEASLKNKYMYIALRYHI